MFSSLLCFGLLASSAVGLSSSGPSKRASTSALSQRGPPPGFVTASGTKFQLDGEDFYFAGSNAYYLPFLQNATDVDAGLAAAKAAGLSVIRTWGFNDKNRTYNPSGKPQYGAEGGGPTDIVFQWFESDGTTTIDLSGFDKVVNAAEKHGIKLLIALTNNWADYGGMDVYTTNLGFRSHDDFYREPSIKALYKNYVKTFVNRYKHSPAIFAWELANEPRCGADLIRNLWRSWSCNSALLGSWIDEMSTFVKSIDPDHMVTWGGEGAYNQRGNLDTRYNGFDGGDFDHEMTLPNIDFGVFHTYPDWWFKTISWTARWIRDHAASGRAAGKPVVHEEYGWLTPAARWSQRFWFSFKTRPQVYGEWQSIMLEEKMAGDLYWQFGYSNYSYGRNHDDGFTIYLDDQEAQQLVYQHARNVNALNVS
ncbi:cellulase [Microdochium trichocladiopsis]|uniref:Mannan endo-1,4-beta-mannosidase A n=1 Tax=Microdochium trichocladiopsis TaxID=1682393 RepID=A0A9P9BPA6_9PEZI|nr:cellulase [Microdochium trichocladiopsis]KAH7029052.1 cellulase [Microdochium trichocladiopsis]